MYSNVDRVSMRRALLSACSRAHAHLGVIGIGIVDERPRSGISATANATPFSGPFPGLMFWSVCLNSLHQRWTDGRLKGMMVGGAIENNKYVLANNANILKIKVFVTIHSHILTKREE